MAREKISLARGIQCCPRFFFYFFCPLSISILLRICVRIQVHTRISDISDCVETVFELPLLPNSTAGETFVHKSEAVLSADWIFFQWGAGLAVTGQTRDIAQNVLQLSFQTESTSSPVTFSFKRIHQGGLY